MAKLKKSLASSSSETVEQKTEHNDLPPKINLYDSGALKHTLDDVAKEIACEAGYEENLSISNTKIALGLFSICCALYAQFGPGKFPANWWATFYCVVLYCIASALLSIYSYYKEGEAFVVTRGKKRRSRGLRMISRMQRYNDVYTLEIAPDQHKAESLVKFTASVTAFFHSDGYLAKAPFEEKVVQLLADYEAASSKKRQ